MTQQQLIEIFKRHAPELTETEIRMRLNNASDMFSEETRMLQSQWSFTTNPNQMYYDLSLDCVGVRDVNYNGKLSDRLMDPSGVLIGR